MVNKKINFDDFFHIFIKGVFIYYFYVLTMIKIYLNFFNDIYYYLLPILNSIFLTTIMSYTLVIYLKKIDLYKSNKYINIFIFIFIYLISYLIFHFLFGKNYITIDVLLFQFKMILYSILYLTMGMYFYYAIKNIEKRVLKLYFSTFIIYLIFILLHFNLETLSIDIKYFSGAHQLIGDSFAVVGLLMLICIRYKITRIVIMTLVLLILFIVKSRATFYSFIIVYIVFIVNELGIKNSLYLFILMTFSSILLIVLDVIPLDQRMFGVFQGKHDVSLSERLSQFNYGIDAIKNNWFFGEYAGQIKVYETGYRSGIMGAYMHNILSFWRQFGLIFFVIFLITYFYGFYKLFIAWQKSQLLYIQFIFYVSLFFGLELILFRSYTFPYFWFALGLMYTHIYNSDLEKKYSE